MSLCDLYMSFYFYFLVYQQFEWWVMSAKYTTAK